MKTTPIKTRTLNNGLKVAAKRDGTPKRYRNAKQAGQACMNLGPGWWVANPNFGRDFYAASPEHFKH